MSAAPGKGAPSARQLDAARLGDGIVALCGASGAGWATAISAIAAALGYACAHGARPGMAEAVFDGMVPAAREQMRAQLAELEARAAQDPEGRLAVTAGSA